MAAGAAVRRALRECHVVKDEWPRDVGQQDHYEVVDWSLEYPCLKISRLACSKILWRIAPLPSIYPCEKMPTKQRQCITRHALVPASCRSRIRNVRVVGAEDA